MKFYGADHVTYARNFTDIDDKINARAAATGRDISHITEETIGWYMSDMGALAALEPNIMPRATDYIAQMITMTEDLIAKGHAYAAEGHVLFNVNSCPDYGALSGRSIDDMIAGARVEVAPYKRDPMDFVLWKPSNAQTPGWDSPWGRGRPVWHIECSAMSLKHLGETFDIHGGGRDLLFPHHEAEIFQSECCLGIEHVVKYWIHNGMINVDGEKMSKSLGNGIDADSVLECGAGGKTGSWKVKGPDKTVSLRANKIGSECFRLWKACDAQVGDDFHINPEEIEKKYYGVLTKVFNVARFASMFPCPDDLDTTPADLAIEDKWIIAEFQSTMSIVEKSWHELDIYTATQALKSFATGVLPSHWLEMVKSRLYDDDEAAAWTIHRIVRDFLSAFSPICPFFSHHISLTIYSKSAVDVDSFPVNIVDELAVDMPQGDDLRKLTSSIQEFNSSTWNGKKEAGISLNKPISGVIIPDELSDFTTILTSMHSLE